MGTFSYHVTMGGADFDPSYIPASLSDAVTMFARRGDVSSGGEALEEGSISFVVGSVDEAASAIRSVRALQPDQVNHAECVVGYWFKDQCNLEFSETELSALVAERVSLSISCYPQL